MHSLEIGTDPDGPQIAVSVRELGIEREAFARRYGLSPREAEVAELVLRGYPNPLIASTLGIAEATAKEEGKPEAALARIVEGRVNGYFKENVLLEQPFAKEPKKTVAKVLQEAGADAKGFVRFRVGS